MDRTITIPPSISVAWSCTLPIRMEECKKAAIERGWVPLELRPHGLRDAPYRPSRRVIDEPAPCSS